MEGSPFSEDELQAQSLAGSGSKGTAIRTFMPDQHREFFRNLQYVFVSVADSEGWPIATLVTGAPGFVSSPDAKALRIDGHFEQSDPGRSKLSLGDRVGILGLELSTRRRNRVNGQVTAFDETGLTLHVEQSFGNCAQYIQSRTVEGHKRGLPSVVHKLSTLNAAAVAIIERADTFFIASVARESNTRGRGLDMSHRGGQPGFVRIDGQRLSIPDFRGNRYYNTLGNLLGEPRASLLFIDFENGTALQLQGRVEIDWDGPLDLLPGAERYWHFNVERYWHRPDAIPFTWSAPDFSPRTLATGTWCQNGSQVDV